MKKLPIMLLFLILAALFVLPTCGREGPLPPPISTPPGIKSTIPTDGTGANGVNGYPIDGAILITFTLDMDPTTINNQTITVVGSGGIGPIAGTVAYTNGAAIFTPTQNLAQNTGYTVTIAGTVTDIYHIPMGSAVSVFFTTETLPDAAPPSALNPKNPKSF